MTIGWGASLVSPLQVCVPAQTNFSRGQVKRQGNTHTLIMCDYAVELNCRHSFAFPSSFASCAKNTALQEEHNKIFPTFVMFVLILLAALKP